MTVGLTLGLTIAPLAYVFYDSPFRGWPEPSSLAAAIIVSAALGCAGLLLFGRLEPLK